MGKRRILVVDDNHDVLHLVDEALSIAGYEVTTADCGAEAVRRGGMCLPDLVLLDIMMPDADGYAVYERLRAKPSPALNCPIIFLTAHKDIDHKLLGFQKGAVDYIIKPFHVSELHRPREGPPARGGAALGRRHPTR